MSLFSTKQSRHRSPTASAAVVLGLLLAAGPGNAHAVVPADQPSAIPSTAAEDDSIRPFHIHVPDETLVDLRRRIAATRWPDKETVADQTQGVQEAKIQALVHYWGTDYDWRKAETRLNALPISPAGA
ncbi:epoxide hydrolase N-terminal domain-containing protein [Paraburkholderia sp. RCC_158]|uniref:epoxide hydrolase N-terminal domain-containing protein n=1 Tax=Paraburkholderia sp. RCC_158 TaxID=3239220 RepID=UPI003525738E